MVGQPYQRQINILGGTGPYSFVNVSSSDQTPMTGTVIGNLGTTLATFTTPGNKTISGTISDSGGQSGSFNYQQTVNPVNGTGQFTLVVGPYDDGCPVSRTVPCKQLLTAINATLPIASANGTSDDGTPVQSSVSGNQITASEIYQSLGLKTITFSATDNAGNKASLIYTILVGSPPATIGNNPIFCPAIDADCTSTEPLTGGTPTAKFVVIGADQLADLNVVNGGDETLTLSFTPKTLGSFTAVVMNTTDNVIQPIPVVVGTEQPQRSDESASGVVRVTSDNPAIDQTIGQFRFLSAPTPADPEQLQCVIRMSNLIGFLVAHKDSHGRIFGTGSGTYANLSVALDLYGGKDEPVDPGAPLTSEFIVRVTGNPPFNVFARQVPLSFPLNPEGALTDEQAAEPVSLLTGELFDWLAPDLSLGGPFSLVLARRTGSFMTMNGIPGSLGTNWAHNFDVRAFVSATNAAVATWSGAIIRFVASGTGWSLASPYKLDYQFITTSDGNYRFLDPADNAIYTFGPNGFLIRVEDRNGNALAITQGPNGPQQVADGLGRTLTFSYGTGGRLTMVADQSGRSVSYSYSGSNLASFTDAAGKVTTYTTTTAGTTSGFAGVVNGLISKTTLPAGNTSFSQTFDGNARVVSQSDGLGNTSKFAYSNSTPGDAAIQDALGNVTTVSHANLRDFTKSIDARGQVTTTAYDSHDRPKSMVDRNGNTWTSAYHDPSGYLASFTDAAGNTTKFSYLGTTSGGFTFYDRNVITYPDGTFESFAYDGNGNLIKFTDRAGKATTFTYNARGQVLTATNPVSGVTTLTYNTDGTLATAKSPAGDTTAFSYDSLKRVNQVKYANGATRSLTYDALDRVSQTTDPRGNITAAAYTDNGELNSVTDPLNNTATLGYDASENLSSVKTPAGATKATYNAVNLVSTVTAATGETANLAYDKQNRVSSMSDAVGRLATYTYNNEDAVTSVTDGANRTFKFAPDALGRTTQVTTPLGNIYKQSFDALSRPISFQDPLGAASSVTYDPRGLVSSVSLPGSVQASYSYNDLGNLVSIKDPNGNSWTRSYDNLGRITSRQDPAGKTIAVTYDSRNRVSSGTSADGTGQFSYDAGGNLTRSAYSDGTVLNYTYDADNRVTSANGVSLAYDGVGAIVNSNGLAITRDASSRIASVAYPPGKVTYTYNNRGLLASVTDWTGASTSFTYEASLRLSSIARPNGVVTQYSYDADGNLSGITETNNGKTLSSITLQRDPLGQITSADRTQPQAAAPAPGTQSATFGADDQIVGATYDGTGRLTKDALRTYKWDLASRLTSYQGADGSASFTYDAFGMRTSRTSGGATENYTINYALDLPSIAVVNSGSKDQRYYIHWPSGSLLCAIDAGTIAHHYYHFDEAGNTLFLSGDAGTVTDSYGITPFGESVTLTGSTPNPFTWQGQFGVMAESSTSLFYMRARYYDSASARFISRDPLDLQGPKEVDPYEYGLAAPLRFADPSGMGAVPTSGFRPDLGSGVNRGNSRDCTLPCADPWILGLIQSPPAILPGCRWLCVSEEAWRTPIQLNSGTCILPCGEPWILEKIQSPPAISPLCSWLCVSEEAWRSQGVSESPISPIRLNSEPCTLPCGEPWILEKIQSGLATLPLCRWLCVAEEAFPKPDTASEEWRRQRFLNRYIAGLYERFVAPHLPPAAPAAAPPKEDPPDASVLLIRFALYNQFGPFSVNALLKGVR
jgi:RHS repeat-associated protein